jgi:hypothetical protein
MTISNRVRLSGVLLTLICVAASCSGDKRVAGPAGQPSSASQQGPAQVQQPQSAAAVPPAAETKVSGTPAAEKYQLTVTNYAKVAVTVTLNGEWIGQWDSSNSVPLQPIQGKNQLTVEVAGQPTNALTIDVNVKRNGQDVKILSANGQSGSHTYTFMAK